VSNEERFLGFRQTHEVKVVRRKYEVGFHAGTTVGDLQHMLNRVPAHCEVDEVLCDDEDSTGVCTIVFHQEFVDE
jgi:hypothetical protein